MWTENNTVCNLLSIIHKYLVQNISYL